LNFAVGKLVTIAGSQEGDAEVDVDTIDGVAIREPGKPPWARWAVGRRSVASGAGRAGWRTASPVRATARETAPGQLKQASPAP